MSEQPPTPSEPMISTTMEDEEKPKEEDEATSKDDGKNKSQTSEVTNAAAPGAVANQVETDDKESSHDAAAVAEVKADPAENASEGGDEEAPTLVEAKPSDDKVIKELDDEAPKTFPQVLMDILSNEEDADTISWLPHGRSFIIYKKKRFAHHVLPKYFKATKFTSFTRKLNRWGFTRVTRGPEMGSYYHKLFLRDDPSLCLRMSSHSSSKFNETQQQLMPAPMTPMPFGMPMAFGMPGMQPMMPGAMPGMNPADLSQQNQFINQQLQQLQWQQFQLQQLQQQQHHHAQQQGHNPHGPPQMHAGPPPPHYGQAPPLQQSHHVPPQHHGQPPSHMQPPPQQPNMAPPHQGPPAPHGTPIVTAGGSPGKPGEV